MKVISGGQTGADQGALFGAQEAGVETGGTATRGWRTEGGPAHWLAQYGLTESPSPAYPPRTLQNVWNSDATVIFGHMAGSRGSQLTLRYCDDSDKPSIQILYLSKIDETKEFIEYSINNLITFMKLHNVQILNVAGNRESTNPGISRFTQLVIKSVLQQLQPEPMP